MRIGKIDLKHNYRARINLFLLAEAPFRFADFDSIEFALFASTSVNFDDQEFVLLLGFPPSHAPSSATTSTHVSHSRCYPSKPGRDSINASSWRLIPTARPSSRLPSFPHHRPSQSSVCPIVGLRDSQVGDAELGGELAPGGITFSIRSSI
jgi:hypothetical protein